MKELFLITGFLGSGKTTLLNMVINAFADRRIAVIVNEFGKRGVDGTLILNARGGDGYAGIGNKGRKAVFRSGDGAGGNEDENGGAVENEDDSGGAGRAIDVTEITNGSIFCVCRIDMFLEALAAASKTDADILLVETSGLADPTNINGVLSFASGISGTKYNYKGCVCLADAANFHKVRETAAAVPNQIRQASLVVINKCDLAEADMIDAAEDIIKKINPNCAIYRTTYAQVPKELFIRLQPINTDVDVGGGSASGMPRPTMETGNGGASGVPRPTAVAGGEKGGYDRTFISKRDITSGSLSFTVAGKPSAEAIKNFIDAVVPFLYRCKGYASLSDGYYYVDGVMGDATLTKIGENAAFVDGIVMLYKNTKRVRTVVREAALANNIDINII